MATIASLLRSLVNPMSPREIKFDVAATSNLGLVIDFPPGSTMLIPSANIRLSNTTIEASETRYSFPQHATGGLFRWITNSFCSKKAFVVKATKGQREQREEDRQRCWKDGMAELNA
jgi:hypothetical protein